MKTKRIPAARLELVTDKNGDIVWEPRRVPLMHETLGITQRAELARRAMATPTFVYRRPSPAPLADFDEIARMPWWAWAIYLVCFGLVLAGIGVLVWASI